MNISNNLRIKLEKILKKVGKQVSENEKKKQFTTIMNN